MRTTKRSMHFLEGLLLTLVGLGVIALILAIVFGVQLFMIAITDGHPAAANSQQPNSSSQQRGVSSSSPGVPGGGR